MLSMLYTLYESDLVHTSTLISPVVPPPPEGRGAGDDVDRIAEKDLWADVEQVVGVRSPSASRIQYPTATT